MKPAPLKRSPMPPRIKPLSGILRTANLPAPKLRHCKAPGCRELFNPAAPYITWHSPECGTAIALAKLTRIKAAKAKLERKKDRARKDAIKSRSDYVQELQIEFNKFIRTRDRLAGHACISSGRPLDWSGNAVDAGHYRSVGSAPHLRFDQNNCHAQSKQDNRYGSGNAVDYRIGLIARIGLEAVEALEADQSPRHFTIDDLKALKALYRAKTKELLRAAA